VRLLGAVQKLRLVAAEEHLHFSRDGCFLSVPGLVEVDIEVPTKV
jgi:hypothetical protein